MGANRKVVPSPQNTGLVGARRPRFGCSGCLWQLIVILVLAAISYWGIIAVFAPWAFYLGGKFHITPYWQGWGKLHAKSGDYLLFLRIEPTSRGSRMYLETNLSGTAYVCTPRGENITLKMSGGMRKHLNLSTDGEAIHLGMHYWPWNANFVTDYSPSIALRGHWQNPNLVMDDQGSIAKAFLPDGSVYHGHDRNPTSPEVVPVTFVEGSCRDFSAACTAMHR
jgi:hypothetical protein